MAPLVVLVAVTGLTRLAGWLHLADWLDSWPHAARLGVAAMFTLTATAHFAPPLRNQLIAMVPPRLPSPTALVTLTGILEFAGAAALLIPPTAPTAAACLALLLLTMFPANIHAAHAQVGMHHTPLRFRTLEQALYLTLCILASF